MTNIDLRYEQNWLPGDIVSRDGTDEHEIIENESKDLLTVKCIKAPDIPWTELGELETNTARRYHFVRRPVKIIK